MSNDASPGAATQVVDEDSTASGPPRLLVSVRSAVEARAAVQGGADIIDIKEPTRGSLGMADADTMAAVVQLVRTLSPDVTGLSRPGRPRTSSDRMRSSLARFLADGPDLPVSAALGELMDQEYQETQVAGGLSFVKLGLAGMGEASDWRHQWKSVRGRIEQQCESSVKWVGVAYADAATAGSPPPKEVITEAAIAGCAGVLIDTFGKSKGRLIDHVSPGQLHAWADHAHQFDLFFALAGQIQARDLPELEAIPADVIAVRSAVCPANRRDAELSSDLVALFRRQLHQIRQRDVPSGTQLFQIAATS